MQNVNPATAEMAQVTVAKGLLAVENQLKSGTGWFFWIAALSVINSAAYFAGSSISFLIGLGASELVASFAQAVADELDPGPATVIRAIGFGLTLVIAGLFALCGVLGRKRYRWPVAIGIVLYALDAVIYLVFGQWLSVFFHIFAVVGLWRGLAAINTLAALDRSQAAGDLAAMSKLLAVQPAANPRVARKNFLVFVGLVIGAAAILLGVLMVSLALVSR
jgi:uncharacterized membrane protein